MENSLKHYKYTLLINGIIALLFGFFALTLPGPTSLTIATYFGIVLIAGGVVGIIAAIRNLRKDQPYIYSMAISIISTLVGVYIALNTLKSLEIFALIIGIWAIVLAVVQLIIALNILPSGANKKALIINSIITLVFGAILFFNPFASVIGLVIFTGILSIIFGSGLIYFALSIKSTQNK